MNIYLYNLIIWRDTQLKMCEILFSALYYHTIQEDEFVCVCCDC